MESGNNLVHMKKAQLYRCRDNSRVAVGGGKRMSVGGEDPWRGKWEEIHDKNGGGYKAERSKRREKAREESGGGVNCKR